MKFLGAGVVLAFVLISSGCATATKVKNEAFRKPQTLAVVSMAGSVRGMFTNESEDFKILNDTASTCFSEVAKSKNVRLLYSKNVINSKSYAMIKDDGAPFSTSLVPGYKGIALESEKNNLKALAKELRVDGFLATQMVYGASSGGSVSVMGISVGAKKPEYTIVFKAFNANGESIWEDYVHGIGEEGIMTVVGIGAYSELLPKLNTVTKIGCKQLVANLAEQLRTK